MEQDNYRSWTFGPFEFGFENEWLGSREKSLFLFGCGWGEGGFGVGCGLLGLVGHVGLLSKVAKGKRSGK